MGKKIKCRENKRPGLVFLIGTWALLALVLGCAGTRPGDNPCTMAVWEVENLGVSGTMADMGGLMTARVLETLQASGRCTLIERERLTLALEELNLSAAQLADENTRLQIGRIAGAQRMIFGGYQIWGDTMRLDLRMVDVESGAVLQAATQTATATDVPQWLEAAAQAAQTLENSLPAPSK